MGRLFNFLKVYFFDLVGWFGGSWMGSYYGLAAKENQLWKDGRLLMEGC